MNVHSIFQSISGEQGFIRQGTWCTFIRFQGCNLRCVWCDTKNAQGLKGGQDLEVCQIMDTVRSLKAKHIIITAGEPLLQKDLNLLVDELNSEGYFVQIETNGSMTPWGKIKANWVVDYKLPSSGMRSTSLTIGQIAEVWKGENLAIKFVIDWSNEHDGQQMLRSINELMSVLSPIFNGPILISPLNADGKVIPEIVDYIQSWNPVFLDSITFSIQLHKLINMP